MNPIQIPRGTQDLLPQVTPIWQFIEKQAQEICRLYNYQEIRTPIFESTDLFLRGVGDTTDIVQKEMYSFEDRGGRSLTLRPEGTASVVRSYVQEKMYGQPNQPTKLYYIGPMFRYERPQAGRYRQFFQFGVEAIGALNPAVDAEVISLAMSFYKNIGLTELKLVINSLGDKESRLRHREALINHFEPSIGEFCSDCQSRLHKNPLRILDCKQDHDHPLMKTAPSILEFLNEESKNYFEQVKSLLDQIGIQYVVDPTLVRGLDYYNHTTFEIMGASFGSISTLCGGGRYNGLVQELGGPESPGIGFALSIERAILALEAEGKALPGVQALDAFVVSMGEPTEEKALSILYRLRQAGFSVDKDYMDRKMKAQMKQADRFQSRFVLLLGEEELEKQVINVKNMETGEQEAVNWDDLITYLERQLRRNQ
ncbi:histidine--tRNA ligase [Pullulanibacillus sp. KACC 23026]|uniref:histidine--tRNA ligase n=1 Tax=Pullulanibacillus sp. KACC 23026 TaxID=3028315 RepID=UPI0023B014E6|nr:histidine--tRNA ligase [Pullulanibacillus sp. KACC 23026]WEG14084.1 histidine--tRNA ligase [Pullulanibacillus sp. KACC 23026]